MEFVKKFCRLVVPHEISNDDVAEFYDVVQSVIPTKVVTAYNEDGDFIEANVMAYDAAHGGHIYEIVLDHQVDIEEGEEIADLLAEVLDFDFEFETSLEI